MHYYAETEQNLINLEEWTMEWVNKTFIPLGLPPIEEFPKGEPSDGVHCVLGKVLNKGFPLADKNQEWYVSTKWIDIPTEFSEQHPSLKAIELPFYVQEFIEAFDEGYYPDLTEEPHYV